VGLCAIVQAFPGDASLRSLARSDFAQRQARRRESQHTASLGTVLPNRARGRAWDKGLTVGVAQPGDANAYSSPLQRTFAGKHVYILTHEISASGAPRVCTELALVLLRADAQVSLATYPSGKITSVVEMASQVSALIPNATGLNLLTDAPLDVASTADLVIVATAVSWQAAWLRRFRNAYPSYPALVWWIHEGSAVMKVFPETDTRIAVDIISAQHPRVIDAVIFPSWATRTWWIDEIARSEKAVTVRTLPPVAAVVHWGVPSWRASKMSATRSDSSVRAESRAMRGYERKDFVFVVLGTFHPIKGYVGVFKAFDLARKACGPRLRLLASGTKDATNEHLIFPPDLAWVREDSAVQLENITKAVPAFLAAGDVYISNTKAGGETWGLATLEALAMGLPSLVSRAGGSLEMVEHGVTALMHDVAKVTRPQDDTGEEIPQLAYHMCVLARDAELRDQIGTAGRELVTQRLNQAHIDEALVNTFAGLLQASAGWQRPTPHATP